MRSHSFLFGWLPVGWLPIVAWMVFAWTAGFWLPCPSLGQAATEVAQPVREDDEASTDEAALPRLAPTALPARDAPASDAPPATATEIARLIAELDHDQFEVRERASAALDNLAKRPQMQAELAAQVQQVLRSADTAFETRSRLTQLARNLPRREAPPPDISEEELDRLIAQMDADSYAVRLGSAARLQWLTNRPELACLIMTRLKSRLVQRGISVELRDQMEPILEAARRAWLTSDPAAWRLPDVTDQQIERWLEDLAAVQDPGAGQTGSGDDAGIAPMRDGLGPQIDGPGGRGPLGVAPGARARPAGRNGQAEPTAAQRAAVARRELLDLLARDAYVPRIRAAIEQRTAAAGADVHPYLKELLDWTRPAMVAEYWEQRRHRGIQHLLIGVPSFSPLAERPSHFDRIDDRTAHCVSGNALTAGLDYPVGVLFPHPKRIDAQFHLVNLPTARHRLAYEYLVKADEATRLAEISKRTLDSILAEKRVLSQAEVMMLQHLDAASVSCFAGDYFLAVDDVELPAGSPERTAGWISPHDGLCLLLAAEGTRDAIPGLLKAIELDRFPAPSAESPYDLPWIAALAIATHDPWPEVEAWLFGLVGEDAPLGVDGSDAAQLGASAAALLLLRHAASPEEFGLVSCWEEEFGAFKVGLYRFASPDGPQRVAAWWRQAAGREPQAMP